MFSRPFRLLAVLAVLFLTLGCGKQGPPQPPLRAVPATTQDLTVTQSMFHNENVIMGTVTPQWRAFCTTELGFKVPDDFDLMPAKTASDPPAAQ